MRPVCLTCRRPRPACYCDALPRLASDTRVVFLQHPRERRVAIGTARMAHLALPNSELHEGVSFEDHPRLQALVASGEAALLFPGASARPPESFGGRPPKALVVVDGTWPQAQKMLKKNPLLQALPQVALAPRRPGNYRIRREPAAHCLSTIEAVVEVLGALEGDDARYRAMLGAFERMVDFQLACADSRIGPPRTRRKRAAWARAARSPLVSRAPDLVLVHAEGQSRADPGAPGVAGPHELIHLVALRPGPGARFEALVRPKGDLRPSTPIHLELGPDELAGAEAREAALQRFRAFLRQTDVLCSWGGYSLSLLRSEGLEAAETVDLRIAMAHRLRRRPGALDDWTGGPDRSPAPWAKGRAGRRMAALEAVLGELSAVRPS